MFRLRKLLTPDALCVIVLALLASAQLAVLFAEFWPQDSGIAELVVWMFVGSGVSVILVLAAALILTAWYQRRRLRNRRRLNFAAWLFVLLPLTNAFFLGWWPTAERLGMAAWTGQVDVVKRCLFFGIDPNATYIQALGFGGRAPSVPPLQAAAGGGHLEIVRLLVDAGADVDGNDNGALRVALWNAEPKIVRYLLERGADHGDIPADLLSEEFGRQPAQQQALTVLLELRPAAVDRPWLLLAAAHQSHPDTARAFAGVDVRNRYGPIYELHRSVVSGEHARALRLYAGIEEQLQEPRTEEHRAEALDFFAYHYPDRVAPLEQVNQETLLSVAARFGATSLAAELIRAGAPVEPPMDRLNIRRSPLHRAVWNDHPESAAALLDAGADVQRISRGFGTPLHTAVLRRSAALVTLLLDAGADINAPRSDVFKETALMTAIRLDDLELVELLVERDADLGLRDKHGLTACERGRAQANVANYMAGLDCGD